MLRYRKPSKPLWPVFILAHSLLAQFLALVDNRLGVQDLRHAAKADDPAEEHGGNGYLDSEVEVVFAVGDQHGIPTEAVDDHIGQFLVESHLNRDGIAGEHLKQLIGVL